MARKKAKIRTRTRTVTKRVKSGGTSIFSSPTVQGLIYGVLRTPIKNGVNNITAGVPGLNVLTNQSDEILLWLTGTGVSKFAKGNTTMKRLGKTMQTVEAQNLGQQINTGGFASILGGANTASTTTTSVASAPINGQGNF